MDLSGSAMSIPDENLKLFVPLRRNLGNIEFGLALYICRVESLFQYKGKYDLRGIKKIMFGSSIQVVLGLPFMLLTVTAAEAMWRRSSFV